MRPPNDLPPANSGSLGTSRAASATAARTVSVRELGRVGPLAALLHVGKLVAQGRDAALGKLGRDRRHERMVHARAGAVRQHVAGARTRRDEQQAGDALGVADRDAD